MLRPVLLVLLLAGVAPPVHAQAPGGTSGGQGANTAPGLRYGAELLLGRSHAQSGGGARDSGQDRERVVLRRHGAETMPAIQAGQINQAARLQIQEPDRPNDTRLLSGGGGRGGNDRRIIPFGAERNVEGAGGQGGERPRLAAFPPRDPSTAPGANRAATPPGQASPTPTGTRPPTGQIRPATNTQQPQAQTQAPTPQARPSTPTSPQAPSANVLQNILPPGNRFSDIAHEGLPAPPALSEGTRNALDRLTPRQQEAYRASVRDIIRSNPRRTLSEPEVRLLIEAAQSR